MTAIELHNNGGLALADEWNRDRIDLIKRTYCQDATDDEFALFLATCQRVGLSPEARQIFAIKRWTKGGSVMTIQTSIDGYRLIAQRSKEYAGQIKKQWCGADGAWVDVWLQDGPPLAAKAGVWRVGFVEPLEVVVHWAEYVQTNKDGKPTSMWATKPALMLAKCAEAAALRAAFPAELSGLYTVEEMGQADNMVPPRTTPPPEVDASTGEVVTKRRPPPLEVGKMVPPRPAAKTEDVGRKTNPYAEALHILASDVAKATDLEAGLLADAAVMFATGNKSSSAFDLTRTDKDRAVLFLCEVRDGKAQVVSTFDGEGNEAYVLAPTLDDAGT